jgi:hypothetical protein
MTINQIQLDNLQRCLHGVVLVVSKLREANENLENVQDAINSIDIGNRINELAMYVDRVMFITSK